MTTPPQDPEPQQQPPVPPAGGPVPPPVPPAPGGAYASPGGAYAQPGAGYPPSHPAAPGPQQGRALSVTSFVLGLLGCLPLASLAAIVVGVVALVKKQALRGLAIAGIILGLVWTIGAVAFFASGAASRLADSVQESVEDASQDSGVDGADADGEGERIDTFDLREGDCFDDPAALDAPDEESFVSEDLLRLPCAEPHAFEVYHVSDIEADAFPGQDAVVDEVERVCLETFEDFIGLPYEESVIEVVYYFPTESTWDTLDDRAIVCAVTEGESTVGSLEGARR